MKLDGYIPAMSKQDQRPLEVWEKSATIVTLNGQNHYQLALPWKQGNREFVVLPPLVKCQAMAKKRMSNL